MNGSRRGFTIIEVLMAVVILGLGVIALAATSGVATRMIGRGRQSTFAAQIAQQKLEQLRTIAYRTDPPCTDGAFTSGGPDTRYDGKYQLTWAVDAGGTVRQAAAWVQYNVKGGARADTLRTTIHCF